MAPYYGLYVETSVIHSDWCLDGKNLKNQPKQRLNSETTRTREAPRSWNKHPSKAGHAMTTFLPHGALWCGVIQAPNQKQSVFCVYGRHVPPGSARFSGSFLIGTNTSARIPGCHAGLLVVKHLEVCSWGLLLNWTQGNRSAHWLVLFSKVPE